MMRARDSQPGGRTSTRSFARRSGRALTNILILIAVFSIAISALYYFLHEVRRSKQCEANLLKIFNALELYELDRGTLPRLAFYPDDPKVDQDSIEVVLAHFGVDDSVCVCPSAPMVIQEQGLAYVWNVALNGSRMPKGGEPVWLLADIDVLSTDVPAPHLGHYNVLYSDGTVKRVTNPTRQLSGL